jgi:hypothetical protein
MRAPARMCECIRARMRSCVMCAALLYVRACTHVCLCACVGACVCECEMREIVRAHLSVCVRVLVLHNEMAGTECCNLFEEIV